MSISVPRAMALVLAALALAAGTAGAAEQPRRGGVLKVAVIGEPPSLDLHATTAVITQQITWHVYEALYTDDRAFNPVPMLAEGHTVGDRGGAPTRSACAAGGSSTTAAR